MAKSIGSLLLLLLPLFLSLNSGGENLKLGTAMAQSQKTWCVASPSASDAELNANIEYACNTIGNCQIIQSDGCCFNPETLRNHASVVMNQYYAMNGRNTWNCHFSGTGLIVVNDPSYGNCTYA